MFCVCFVKFRLRCFLISCIIATQSIAIQLKCQFEYVDYAKWGVKYTCLNSYLTISQPNTKVIAVNYDSAKDVERIGINGASMLYLPLNFNETFVKLTSIVIVNSGIEFIQNSDFKGLQNITELSLANNKILAHRADTFTDLINLQKLNLQGNRIESLATKMFIQNTKLSFVNYEGNHLQFIGVKTLVLLKSLTMMNLLRNVCINMTVDNSDSRDFRNVIIENCLGSEDPEFLRNLYCDFELFKASGYRCTAENLTTDAKYIRINKVLGTHVGNKSNDQVTELSFRNSTYKFIPRNIFEMFVNLRTLEVCGTVLEVIEEEMFDGALKLQKLLMDSNEIRIIVTRAFRGLSKLKLLSLEQNQINSLPWDIFEDLMSLQILRLSHNHLTKLDANLLRNNSKLLQINFDNNEIVRIGGSLIDDLPFLKKASFANNSCIDFNELSGRMDLLKKEFRINCW